MSINTDIQQITTNQTNKQTNNTSKNIFREQVHLTGSLPKTMKELYGPQVICYIRNPLLC